jgi:hypothetical protein
MPVQPSPFPPLTAARRLAAVAVGALFLGAAAGLPVTTLWHSAPVAGYALAAAWVLVAFLLIRFAIAAARWRGVAACLLAAAVLRILVLLALNGLEGVELGNDYDAYLTLARNLAAGNGLLAHTKFYGWARGLYPPLYPVLLAGAGAAGGFNAVTVLVLNSAIDLAAAGLLWVIGRRLGDARVGLAAAAVYLVWPSSVISAPLAQKEGLATLLALFIALMFHKMLEEGPGWRNAALLGLGTALMALTQPILAPLPFSIALVLLPLAGPRPLILFGMRAMPVAAAAMLPWWIRNYDALGAFVPLTTSLGPALMSAAAGQQDPATPILIAGNEPALSAAMAREAAERIAGDPLAFIAGRAPIMVRSMFFEDYDALRMTLFAPPVAWARMMLAGTQLAYACAAGFALAALARKPALARDGFPAALVLASLLHVGLFNLWFQFAERHRHFMTPFLLLLAASFLVPALQAMTFRSFPLRRSG